ncbi:MAG: class I SAM-dependent methyltransferase [Paludibacteraceae bacterium]|nr:class I SAM-dependent methyltransferase [Paludibacteraceae bacterium]
MTIDDYILEHSQPESELLARLDREANVKLLHPRMVSGHIQGRLLSALSWMIRPERILEIGTYVGYSAMCLAEGLADNGKIITLDIDDEIEDMAREYIARSPYAEKIDFRIGDAVKLIPEMEEVFDLVFIDGNKRDYIEYYECVLPKVKKGGFILADNTLWAGKVAETPESNDYQTKGLIAFNDFIAKDERIDRFILPLRDGLTIMRVR